MNELYMEDLVDFYKTKQFQGNLRPPTTSAEKTHGDDWVRIDLEIIAGRITKAVYSGFGSVMSQGIAAYICTRVVGMSPTEARQFDATGECFFDILPNRQTCATLGVRALWEALDAYTENQSSEGTGSENSARAD